MGTELNKYLFFSQSIAAAICFFYAEHVGLYIQLGILLVLAIIGTISFVKVEWEVKKEAHRTVAEDAQSESGESGEFEKKHP